TPMAGRKYAETVYCDSYATRWTFTCAETSILLPSCSMEWMSMATVRFVLPYLHSIIFGRDDGGHRSSQTISLCLAGHLSRGNLKADLETGLPYIPRPIQEGLEKSRRCSMTGQLVTGCWGSTR